MDLRRFLNVSFAHLTKELDPSQLDDFVEETLRVKFDHEMTPDELRRVRYRRRERELGIVGGQQQLMQAFGMPGGGRA
jgi:hypothetical protein